MHVTQSVLRKFSREMHAKVFFKLLAKKHVSYPQPGWLKNARLLRKHPFVTSGNFLGSGILL
jgi:hypothetical protein